MATATSNYGLIKPKATDNYDIEVPNGNMDKIDDELKKNEDHRNDTAAHVTQAEHDSIASAVQGATIGDVEVPKDGATLKFPAYPTSLPANGGNADYATTAGSAPANGGTAADTTSINSALTLSTVAPTAMLKAGKLWGVY